MSLADEKPLESPDYKAGNLDFPDRLEEQNVATLPMLNDGPLPAKAMEKISTLQTVDIPQRYRWTAFAFILVYSTGAAFTDSVLGPLKSTLLKELKINSMSFRCVFEP
jgi:hypothetical protein